MPMMATPAAYVAWHTLLEKKIHIVALAGQEIGSIEGEGRCPQNWLFSCLQGLPQTRSETHHPLTAFSDV